MHLIAPLKRALVIASLTAACTRLGTGLYRRAGEIRRASSPQTILLALLAFAVAAGLMTKPAAAQSPTVNESVLYSFCGGASPSCPDNVEQVSMVQARDGNFYGITYAGGTGDNGSFFVMTPAGSVTTLYSFCTSSSPTCADGELPVDLIQGSDGDFYGTTSEGGTGGQGTIFKFDSAGTLTTLYTFCSQGTPCTDGGDPALLIQGSDGNFYGTSEGGPNGQGTIFKLTPSGTLTTLYNFCSQGGTACTDGSEPLILVQGSDSNFYGTTQTGGSGQSVNYIQGSGGSAPLNGAGTIFKLTASGQLSTLYTFCQGGTNAADCTDGTVPNDLVEGADGNFYGTTQYGGTGAYANFALGGPSNGGGTAFKITPSGTFSTIYNFCSQTNCEDGGEPLDLIEGSDGNFYGVNGVGDAAGLENSSFGTAFEITSSGALTSLYSFCPSGPSGCTDAMVPVDLMQGNDGNFYGGSYTGGTDIDGALFKLALSPALQPPVQLSLTQSQIDLGQSATLSWRVLNGASDTAQQCYAFVQTGPAGAGTWTGLQTGTASNGAYSGSATITPTAEGTYTYALTCGGVESGFATLTVGAAPPLSVTTTSLPSGTVGTAYAQTLAATGGVPPYTWSVSSGSLPVGLTLSSSTGAITGTPTASGTEAFTVEVEDSASTPNTRTANLSITVNPGVQPAPTVTLAGSPTTGVVAGQTVTLTASETPSYGVEQGYSWTIYDGSTALVSNAMPNAANNGYTLTTPPLSAGTHSFKAVYSTTNSSYSSGTSNTVAITVGLAPTTTTLTASSTSINQNASVTFTATIASTESGSPTGTVEFMNGSADLGSGTVSSGVATFTTTSLPAGTDSITAVYSGDSSFAGSTSSAVQVTVTAPGFTLSASPASLSIAAGQSGSTTITLTPTGGYSGTLNLSCSGLPAYSTCTFSPSSLSPDGSNTAVTSSLTIATNVATAALQPGDMPGRPHNSLVYAAASFAGLLFLCGFRRRKAAAQRFGSALFLVLLLALSGSALLVSGCGGSASTTTKTSVTPAGTSTVVVSAGATGGTAQTLNLTVTITQ